MGVTGEGRMEQGRKEGEQTKMFNTIKQLKKKKGNNEIIKFVFKWIKLAKLYWVRYIRPRDTKMVGSLLYEGPNFNFFVLFCAFYLEHKSTSEKKRGSLDNTV